VAEAVIIKERYNPGKYAQFFATMSLVLPDLAV